MKTGFYLCTERPDRNGNQRGAGAPSAAETVEVLALPVAEETQDTMGGNDARGSRMGMRGGGLDLRRLK
jgi:hypothetical protein